MRFVETPLKGAYVISPDTYEDDRGRFIRIFYASEYAAKGLNPAFVQCDTLSSRTRGMLYGIHFHLPPSEETRVVRCLRGCIYFVIIDMRPESSTFLSHACFRLSAANRRAVYVPELIAYGFQTLTKSVEVEYLMSECDDPQYERGMRYDDPLLRIEWPAPVTLVAPKDLSWPLMVNVVKPNC